jgi:DNA-binding FadR family transcriptional regulator
MGVVGDKNDPMNLFGLLGGRIERGELAAGQPLPSAAALAQEYGIKPEVAAKALKALEGFGLIEPGPPGPEYAEYYVRNKRR